MRAVMKFEDKWEDVLICPECGHSIDSDRYGCESDEEYEALYPTEEEVLGYNEDEDESDGSTTKNSTSWATLEKSDQ